MTSDVFVSYAQNREDVVLQRALGDVEVGSYIEVGANHPTVDSVSRSFYNRGWSGLAIEPNPEYATMYRSERPRDTVLEAAVTDDLADSVTFHIIAETGLSTLMDDVSAKHSQNGYVVKDVTVPTIRLDTAIVDAGLADAPIHFLMVDVEGAEAQVLSSIDFSRFRPWVLVIEAVAPLSRTSSHEAWEPIVLAAGYRFTLFDGLSRFYVADEKAEELGDALSYAACVTDHYTTRVEQNLREDLEHAREEAREQSRMVEAMRNTVSWRVTRPLRVLRRAITPSPSA